MQVPKRSDEGCRPIRCGRQRGSALVQAHSWRWYPTDFNFRDEPEDDTIIFRFYVTPETFERYAEEVKAGQVDQAENPPDKATALRRADIKLP